MIRKIQDIAPLLAEEFTDFEPNEDLQTEYVEILKKGKGYLGNYYKYLPQLHDSWIIENTKTNTEFSMTLNDFSRFVFASALIDKKELNVNKDNLEFPLQLKFKINDFSFNTVTESGLIEPIKLIKTDVFLYEQFRKIETDLFEIAWVVYKEGKENPGQYYLILISASEFEIIENQDKNWRKYFGNDYNDYLNYYKKKLELGDYISDQWICEELIEKFDKRK